MQVPASGSNCPSCNARCCRVWTRMLPTWYPSHIRGGRTMVASRSGSPMALPKTMISWLGRDGIRSTGALTLTAAAPSDLGAMNWRSIATIRPAGLTGLQMHMGDGWTSGSCRWARGATTGLDLRHPAAFHDPLEGRLARLRNRFSTFGGACGSIWPRSSVTTQVICSAMEWMEFEKWHTGRVVLVGDAAHASSPMDRPQYGGWKMHACWPKNYAQRQRQSTQGPR